MPLVNCPECGGGVSSAAPACPHCGFPRPGGPAAPPPAPPPGPPPSRGVPAGWIIFGFLAVGALALGLLGWGAYRLLQRADHVQRDPAELVDFMDSVPPPQPAGPTALPDYVDSARQAYGGGARTLPPDSGTYELSALDSPPRLLNRDEVMAALSRNYPPLMRDAGIGGSVTVRFRITRDGAVDAASVEVLDSNHEAFSEAAVRVAGRMRFTPGRYNGSPVAVWVTQPVTFQPAG